MPRPIADALTVLETGAGLPGPDHLPLRMHGLFALIAGHRDDPETAKEHVHRCRSGRRPLTSAGGLADGDSEPVLVAAGYCESAGRPFNRAQALEDSAALLAPTATWTAPAVT